MEVIFITGMSGAGKSQAVRCLEDIGYYCVDNMSDQGKGIGKAGGHSGGLAVFVDRTVPGDTVKVRITKVKKHYAYANLIKIIEPSEHRIAPLCPYADICGGCAFAHLDYEGQLDVKYGQVMIERE